VRRRRAGGRRRAACLPACPPALDCHIRSVCLMKLLTHQRAPNWMENHGKYGNVTTHCTWGACVPMLQLFTLYTTTKSTTLVVKRTVEINQEQPVDFTMLRASNYKFFYAKILFLSNIIAFFYIWDFSLCRGFSSQWGISAHLGFSSQRGFSSHWISSQRLLSSHGASLYTRLFLYTSQELFFA
jgi:hypothetical protein